MTESDLAIVIVTHNSAAVLGPCLEAIEASLRKNIYLVDNHSDDDTLKIAGRYDINIFTLPQNLGFAKAANFGAEKARQCFLCFLNPDCEPENDFFQKGIEAISQNHLCCAVPELTDGNNHQTKGRQPGYTRLKLATDMIHTNYGYNLICRRLERLPGYHDFSWHWPHGACLFISKENFFANGAFDQRYFMYMEDVAFGRQFSLKGGEILGINAHLLHKEGEGANIKNRHRQTLLNRARRLYAAQNYGAGFALLLGLLALPAEIVRSWRGLMQ